MKNDNFIKDLNILKQRINNNYGTLKQLEDVYERLIEFYKIGLINTNHSSLELITAAYLIKEGFRVYVEHEINGKIIDVYGIKGVDVGVEVETGFVPPTYVANQEEFLKSRVALKAARYSNLASQFFIAVPSYYIPPIPHSLLKGEEERSEEEVRELIRLIKRYHHAFDIKFSDVKSSKINGVIIVNTANLKLKIFNHETFLKLEKFYSE